MIGLNFKPQENNLMLINGLKEYLEQTLVYADQNGYGTDIDSVIDMASQTIESIKGKNLFFLDDGTTYRLEILNSDTLSSKELKKRVKTAIKELAPSGLLKEVIMVPKRAYMNQRNFRGSSYKQLEDYIGSRGLKLGMSKEEVEIWVRSGKIFNGLSMSKSPMYTFKEYIHHRHKKPTNVMTSNDMRKMLEGMENCMERIDAMKEGQDIYDYICDIPGVELKTANTLVKSYRSYCKEKLDMNEMIVCRSL